MKASRGLLLVTTMLFAFSPLNEAKAEWEFNFDMPNPKGVYHYLEDSVFGEPKKERSSTFEVAKDKEKKQPEPAQPVISQPAISQIEEVLQQPDSILQEVQQQVIYQDQTQMAQVPDQQQVYVSPLKVSDDYFVPGNLVSNQETKPVFSPAQQHKIASSAPVFKGHKYIVKTKEAVAGGAMPSPSSMPETVTAMAQAKPVELANDIIIRDRIDPASLNNISPAAGLATMAVPVSEIKAIPPNQETMYEEETDSEAPSYLMTVPVPDHPFPSDSASVFDPDLHRFRAIRGANLAEVLDVWAEDADIDMVWLSDRDFSVLESVTIKSNFEDAVAQVLKQYGSMGIRPVAQLNTDPTTLRKTLIVRMVQL